MAIPATVEKAAQGTASRTDKPDEADDGGFVQPQADGTASGLHREMPAGAAYLRIFRYGSRTDRLLQALASLAAIASGVGIALQTLIFGGFITIMKNFAAGLSSPAGFRRDAGHFALYFVYLGIGRLVLSYAYNFIFTYSAHRVTRNIQLAFFRAALQQEVAFHDHGYAGSIATQTTSNGHLIQAGVSEKLGLTLQGIAAFVAAFVIALVVQWKLTLICIGILPLSLIILGTASRMQAKLIIRSIGVYMRASAFVESVLGGIRIVHAFEMRDRLVRKFGDHLAEGREISKKASPILGVMFSSQFTIVQLGFGLAFWRGIRMLASGEIDDSGSIFTVIMAVILASTNLTSLGPQFINFSQAASAAAKFFVVIDRPSQIDPLEEDGVRLSNLTGTITLANVKFAYPTRSEKIVLDNFSLTFPAGKVTALVGPSGSGKSTIIGLIERWYDPLSGSITLGDQPIQNINLRWLRTSIRLVQQEPVLFRGTVLENIRHGLCGTPWEHASAQQQFEKIQEAARIAFAHEFIENLPNGYNTDIGQRGGLLSGGQKQRIAIARSIVSDPKILLLDEATSALDPYAEAVVQQALDRAAKGRTTIVIAHKLSTIRNADNIAVMQKGQIVEQGTHESLIASDGMYARLVKIQDLSVTPDSEKSSETVEDGKDEVDSVSEGLPLRSQETRDPTIDQYRTARQSDRYDYTLHRHVGFPTAVFRLVKEARALTWSYVFAFLSIAGGAAIYPAQAILLSEVVSVFTLPPSEMRDRGDFLSSLFLVLAAACLLSYFTLGYCTNTIAQKLDETYRQRIFHDLLRQDLDFFDRPENSTGALISIADSSPQSIRELMGFNIALIGVSVVSLLVSVVLALAYSWKLGLVVILAGLPPTIGVGLLKVRSDAIIHREMSKKYANSAAIASDSVNAIRTVSSLAIESLILKQYQTELDHAVADTKIPLCKLMTWFSLMQAVEYWFMALGFWYGCRLLSFDEVGLASFLVAFLGVFFAGQAASQLFQFSTSITKGLNGANFIFWLQNVQPAIQASPGNQGKGPTTAESVAMEKMRFSYPLRPDVSVLKGVDITVSKGQFVAFVGASGCGKSTIIGLLERFYDVSSGRITVNNAALPTLDPQLYRRIVALVPQEPILFDGTIRENILLGSNVPLEAASSVPVIPEASEADIESALRSANAWDFVSSLPEGVNTQVGATGSQLSGGQRQRIAIARALIRDPKILLLDEATSALDTESEQVVQNALDRASQSGDRITLAVAHRLSTVKNADMIYVFHQGRVAEAGTHSSLFTRGGLYRKMCEAQALF